MKRYVLEQRAAGFRHRAQRTYRHTDAAAWFMSVGGDECVFGVAEEKLHDPDELVGILAHEVAHAYRARHGLEYRTRREDEPLTFASPRCSDPDCNAKVPRDAELCPGCGGTIEGDVASAEEARARESNLVAPTEDGDLPRLLKGG